MILPFSSTVSVSSRSALVADVLRTCLGIAEVPLRRLVAVGHAGTAGAAHRHDRVLATAAARAAVEQPVSIARVTQASARTRADRAGPRLITDDGR